jgi:hypothetical protein
MPGEATFLKCTSPKAEKVTFYINKEQTMEYQITCPYSKKTLSNDAIIDCAGKQAGLVSTFVFCDCGEKITFSTIITQLKDQNCLLNGSKIVCVNSTWIESRLDLL